MNNKDLIKEKYDCPDHIASLISIFLEYNNYKLREKNIIKCDDLFKEIRLDDGTTINFAWTKYTMQIGIKGICEDYEYQTFVSLPTMEVVNLEPELLNKQMYPVGVYTLLSNKDEKVILACNPYVYDDDSEKEHDTFRQWELVKKSDFQINLVPFLQINKYSPDAKILNYDQHQESPLSYERKPVNLFISYNSHMLYSTLYSTIENALICTEEYKRNYNVQKSNNSNR